MTTWDKTWLHIFLCPTITQPRIQFHWSTPSRHLRSVLHSQLKTPTLANLRKSCDKWDKTGLCMFPCRTLTQPMIQFHWSTPSRCRSNGQTIRQTSDKLVSISPDVGASEHRNPTKSCMGPKYMYKIVVGGLQMEHKTLMCDTLHRRHLPQEKVLHSQLKTPTFGKPEEIL